MASVYEVIEPSRGQRAALKLFHRAGASLRAVQREYRALAGLDHPGIVRVFDCGRLEERPFLLMELVLGRPAQAHARHAGAPGSPRRCAEALRIVHDLVEGLAYLHQRGMVHRDIKSSNVLASATGRVKLLDLGTAGVGRAAAGGARVPGLERFAGTVVYASPEQLRGESVDGRSDLFSVGVLWYRMLTGELPYPAAKRESAIEERRTRRPLAPHLRVPGISPAVGDLVVTLLEAAPGARPSSAQALLERLRPLLATRGGRSAALWPAPPPLFGREGLHRAIEAFLGAAGAGALGLLHGPEGSGQGETLRWVERQARRSGTRTLVPEAGPGGLLSRLLLALPRHVRGARRGMRGSRVERVVQVLERLGRAKGRPLLLSVGELSRLSESGLRDLTSLMRSIAERGLPVRILAIWSDERAPLPELLSGAELELTVLPLPLLDERSADWHLRSMAEGRVLPPRVGGSVLDAGRGRPEALERALSEAVEGGRLRLGRTPEGTACWLEALVGAEDPVRPPGEALAQVLGRGAEQAPWTPPPGPGFPAEMLSPRDLLACEPEDHPDPNLRSLLFAWRGHARGQLGDRDLQADADLLRAEEGLSVAWKHGWEPAAYWRSWLALVRAHQMVERGRQLEASRRLDEAPSPPDSPWCDQLRAAAKLALHTADGVPRLPAGLEDGTALELGVFSPLLRAGLASWRLQRGELDALIDGGSADDAGVIAPWDLEAEVRREVAVARALTICGRLGEARQRLHALLVRLGPGEPGPPRALLHIALAEVELELYRPGVAREGLADAFVLLRHCDRPEVACERERVRGRLALACGEPQRAETAFRTGENLLRGTGFHLRAALLASWRARAVARQGRRREAGELLTPAEGRLRDAGAMPGLTVACAARWEISALRDDPDRCYEPVVAWLERERALMPWLDLRIARLRHADRRRDRPRVERLRVEAAELQHRILDGLEEADRLLLGMRPRYRVLA